MKKILSIFSIFLAMALVVPVFAQDADAPDVAKLTYGKNMWIAPHFLLQVQGNGVEDGTPAGDAWKKQAQIKRARIMLKGQAAENVTFFMETDANQIGANATAKKDVFIQDAFINYKIMDELQIATGMILPAFMHHARQSAVSLLGLNYNSEKEVGIVSLPGNVWRDTGVEFRGLVMNGKIDYHVGIYDGPDSNKNDMPRVTGRIQFNLNDVETDFYYSGNYLGKKQIISFGAGIDYLKDDESYMAWTIDAYIDMKNFTLQLGFVKDDDSTGKDYSGFAEAGYLFMEKIQPVVRFLGVAKTDDTSASYLFVGGNYFINGHNANIKAEFGLPLIGDNTDTDPMKINLQAQLFI